jgi:hypothetical protein
MPILQAGRLEKITDLKQDCRMGTAAAPVFLAR